MRRIRPHLTFANITSLLALFLVLTGGTAVALNGSNTVQSDDLGPGAQVKAPDVAASAVNGSDVLDGSLGLSDLNATSRPHKLEFSVAAPFGNTTIATVGHLRVRGVCTAFAGGPQLDIHLDNVSTGLGTMNALIIDESGENNAPAVDTSGQFVGAGESVQLDSDDSGSGLANGPFNRVEGQVVFQTPGRVTTIDFHASATGPDNAQRCQFYATAVTSNLN